VFTLATGLCLEQYHLCPSFIKSISLTFRMYGSSATWNVFSVICNASSVNTIYVPVKRRIGMCLV
jgi:hypothetical protein